MKMAKSWDVHVGISVTHKHNKSIKIIEKLALLWICLLVQGTARAECTLYCWNYYDKIVVSDVDGTITRYLHLSLSLSLSQSALFLPFTTSHPCPQIWCCWSGSSFPWSRLDTTWSGIYVHIMYNIMNQVLNPIRLSCSILWRRMAIK